MIHLAILLQIHSSIFSISSFMNSFYFLFLPFSLSLYIHIYLLFMGWFLPRAHNRSNTKTRVSTEHAILGIRKLTAKEYCLSEEQKRKVTRQFGFGCEKKLGAKTGCDIDFRGRNDFCNIGIIGLFCFFREYTVSK